ncbi:MAG: RNA methyltransferase [Clostridia bacterium]|nr:RNA methyltransferase [Clostridia bacterium]
MESLITSRDNKYVKLAKSLTTKQGRDKEGLFIIEGYRNVCDAIKKGAKVEFILVSDRCSYDLSVLKGVKMYTLAPRIFDYVSDTVTPQGVMAICRMEELSFSDIDLSGKSLIVVCENLQDPGNAGTIIRSADAAGAKAVIMTKGCVDIYNPKVTRSLMGSLFSVKVVRNKNVDSVFGFLKSNAIKSVAGALTENSQPIFEADMTGNVAVFIGNEGNGLTEDTIKRCDVKVTIPMLGGAESLNASTAGTVMMYEFVRQNKTYKEG